MAVRAVEALGVLLAGTGAVLLFLTRRRVAARATEQPPDPERRAFLNRVMLGSLGIFGIALTGGSVAMLWPMRLKGFGSKIVAGKLDDIHREIEATRGPVYNLEGRFYLVKYPHTDADNLYVSGGAVAGGLMALSQKCPHLGCRVPFCTTSLWFECPCHGALFNWAGEVRRGPAPAGLWRFPIEITQDGSVVVNTRDRVAQPAWGTDTIHQVPAGESCLK